MIVAFSVIGIPIPQPRHRARVQWLGKKAVPTIYLPDDEDVRKFKHDVAFEAGKAFREKPYPVLMDGPLSATLVFVFPRPKYLIFKKKPMPRAWMINVPDLDNLEKSLFDAMNKVVYVDDRQICQVMKEKVYGSANEPPAVHVILQELLPYQSLLEAAEHPRSEYA